MPVNDVLEVRVFCKHANQQSINIVHFQITAVVLPEPTHDIIATVLSGNFGTIYRDMMTNQATYDGVGVRKVFPLPMSSETFGTAAAGGGTVLGDALPKQIAGLLSWRTDLAGPANRGRTYVPFPSETDNDTGAVPTAAYVTKLVTMGNALGGPITVPNAGGSATLNRRIFHRATSTVTPVTFFFTRNRWATQRRRGDFGRPNVTL